MFLFTNLHIAKRSRTLKTHSAMHDILSFGCTHALLHSLSIGCGCTALSCYHIWISYAWCKLTVLDRKQPHATFVKITLKREKNRLAPCKTIKFSHNDRIDHPAIRHLAYGI